MRDGEEGEVGQLYISGVGKILRIQYLDSVFVSMSVFILGFHFEVLFLR